MADVKKEWRIFVALRKRKSGQRLTRKEERLLNYTVDAGVCGQNYYDGAFGIRVGE